MKDSSILAASSSSHSGSHQGLTSAPPLPHSHLVLPCLLILVSQVQNLSVGSNAFLILSLSLLNRCLDLVDSVTEMSPSSVSPQLQRPAYPLSPARTITTCLPAPVLVSLIHTSYPALLNTFRDFWSPLGHCLSAHGDLHVASDFLTTGQAQHIRVGPTDLPTTPVCVRALRASCSPTLLLTGPPPTSHC